MTCMKAQSLITPFINNRLSMEELEKFIDHVESCPKCREELEVYYALLTAMKQLDEDKEISSDFVQELDDKLEKTQERIIYAKYTYYRKITLLFFTMILLAFFISFSYANKSEEDSDYQNIMEALIQKKSDFRLRYEYRIPVSQSRELELRNYLKEKYPMDDKIEITPAAQGDR